MNRLPAILIPLVLAMPVLAQSEQPCYFCDSMPPYKHSIMVQANPGFDDYRGLADFLFYDVSFEDGLPKTFYANLRYGYRLHKNIIVGPELNFLNHKRLLNGNHNILYITGLNVGGYARFLVNRWQVFKPYTDIGISYLYSHGKYSWLENYNPSEEEMLRFRPYNFHRFSTYISPGMSFMIWQNHINIELGIKFSPFRWSNVNGKMFVFTWKIGYNFNSKK